MRFFCLGVGKYRMGLFIQKVTVDQVYPLRSKVLRPGLAMDSCHYVEDHTIGAFHLAAFVEDVEDPIGIASFYLEKHPQLPAAISYRLRGMAVEPEIQSQGVGSILLTQAIDICQKEGADLLWCNARQTATRFYKKLRFKQYGESFDLPGIGEHFVMYRRLKN